MNKGIICNPYLPENEFVPDGEPRLFGSRVYLYGSHDKGGGTHFCTENYVCYSAPKDDLTQWRLEGEIYSKEQDPLNRDGVHNLYAPDVQQGPDGRYYLYYGLDMTFTLSVAVSDSPAGPFSFYGHIQNSDGSLFREEFPYDPSVLYEDRDHIYLYYGFAFLWPILDYPRGSKGGMMVRLAPDMKTVISQPAMVIPAADTAQGTSYAGHAFFEGPSIRKIGEIYYLVYCSENSHELCYATSRYPDKNFVYGGVIVSNGDLGYRGNTEPQNYYGNNHGGLINVDEQWYIFYHRHTHGTQFSRQGCAEKIEFTRNGSIAQVEVTSQGLYGKPLPAQGEYPIHVICNLTGPEGACECTLFGPPLPENTPKLALEEERLVLKNLQAGAVCGVKYMDFSAKTPTRLSVEVRGTGGMLQVYGGEELMGNIPVVASDQWQWLGLDLSWTPTGTTALRFLCKGDSGTSIDIRGFRFK